jgi:hypothetical protein
VKASADRSSSSSAYQVEGPSTTQRVTLLSTVTGLAALTASWSGVRVGAFNVSDAFVVVGLVLIPFSAATKDGRSTLRAWMVLPAFAALVLAARDVILFGRNFATPGVAEAGLSSGQMLARVVLSTICVAVLCIVVVGRHEADGRKILLGWLIGVLLSSAFSLVQGFGLLPESFVLEQVNGTGRFAGLSSHPNALAQTIVLALPLAFYELRTHSGRGRLVAVLALGLLFAAVFQTGSRAGLLIGFVVATASALISASRAQVMRWVLPMVILATALAILYGPALIGTTRFTASAGTIQSNVGRVQSISEGWLALVRGSVNSRPSCSLLQAESCS